MAFSDVIKAPLSWLKNDPVLFLPAVLTWIPLVLAGILAFVFFGAFVSGLLSSGNAAEYFAQNVGQLLALVGLLLVLVVVVGLASFFIGIYVNLVYAFAAKQKHDGKPLSLSAAFSGAKEKWMRGAWSHFLGALVYGAILLFFIVLIGVAVLSAAIPVVGLLIAVLLGVVAVAGVAATALLGSAALYVLMPQIAFSQEKGFAAFKASWNLVWKYKLQSVALVLLLGIVSNILSQIATSALATIWLFVILMAVVSLITTAWVALTATEFWLVYGGGTLAKGASASKATAPTEKPGQPKDSSVKPKPSGRTVKVKVVPKKKQSE